MTRNVRVSILLRSRHYKNYIGISFIALREVETDQIYIELYLTLMSISDCCILLTQKHYDYYNTLLKGHILIHTDYRYIYFISPPLIDLVTMVN